MFNDLCSEGKLDKAKELYYETNDPIDTFRPFLSSCYYGNLKVAQWLYSLGEINYYNTAFKISCNNGHLNIAQWLYTLAKINIHDEYDNVFRISCANGNMEMAKWLYSLGGINIGANNNYALVASCIHKHIEIIKWLLIIEKFNDKTVDDYLPEQLYEYAFSLGYLPIEKMKTAYIQYKKEIRKTINILDINDLINIIMIYI